MTLLIFDEKPFGDPSQGVTAINHELSQVHWFIRLYEERGCQDALLLVLDDLR